MSTINPQRSALRRLYKTKFTLLAVVSVAVGAGLMFLASWASGLANWRWVVNYPVNDIGLALLTTGLFGVLFQYIGQEDAQADSLQQLRSTLIEAAPAIRDAVVDGFAFAPQSLTNVASPATLDQVIENCLGIRLGDPAMAADIYRDLREQVVRSNVRCYDTQASISLAPWEHGPASGRGAMFVATAQWEYRTTPANAVLRFACTSDLDQYADLLRDPTMTSVWYFEPIAGMNGASKEVYELARFALNGKPLSSRRTTRAGTQVYSITLPANVTATHDEVTLSYTYRVLVQKSGHLLHVDIAKPTKNVKVQFFYGGCGIRYVNVLDYFASARQPRITRLPASDPTPSVEVAIDGWILPKAGTGFVWVMEAELSNTPANTDSNCG